MPPAGSRWPSPATGASSCRAGCATSAGSSRCRPVATVPARRPGRRPDATPGERLAGRGTHHADPAHTAPGRRPRRRSAGRRLGHAPVPDAARRPHGIGRRGRRRRDAPTGRSPSPRRDRRPQRRLARRAGGGERLGPPEDRRGAVHGALRRAVLAPSRRPSRHREALGGTLVAYDTVCTHEGCTVEWDGADKVLLCPCHGAAFDPPPTPMLQGPTRQPLAALPITVDAATGTISLQA